MTADLAPNARTRKPKAIHYLREAEFRRRLDAGEERFAAWAAICTDANIGFIDWRGKPSVHLAAVMRTLVRHLRMMAPDSGEMARAQAELDAAAASREMVGIVLDVARGDFDHDKPEVASVRLKGASQALKIVGIGADNQTRVTTNVGVGLNFGDVLRAPLG